MQSITLTGENIALEPLQLEHAPELWEVANYPEIWSFFPQKLDSLAATEKFIAATLKSQDRGVELPFAVRGLKSGKLVGSTRFMDYDAANRSVEIGGTWLTPSVWRTKVNTECKLLLLEHAFEKLKLIRVFFKTDARNVRSQTAIARLGAKYEGVLRKHRILEDGFIRDSVYYSILDDEWPDVKTKLESFLKS